VGDFIYGQRVLPDGTAPGASANERVSRDPAGLPPSTDQEYPAIAYNPDAGNALVVWHDSGHYTDRGEWGIWGRIWVPVDRVFLPLVPKGVP
jgi:hypothetical protein